MNRSIEIVALLRGEETKTVRLSTAHRRREARRAALAAGAGIGVVLLGVTGIVIASGAMVFLPAYVLAWAAVAGGGVALVARRAWIDNGRFAIGPALDAGGFADRPCDLVRLGAAGSELCLRPGMSGQIESGERSTPVEALTGDAGTVVALGARTRAVVEIGGMTYVIRSVSASPPAGGLRWRRLLQPAAVALAMGIVPTLLAAHPAGAALDGKRLRGAPRFIAHHRGVWVDSIEESLRSQAQLRPRPSFRPLGWISAVLHRRNAGRPGGRRRRASAAPGQRCGANDGGCRRQMFPTAKGAEARGGTAGRGGGSLGQLSIGDGTAC